MYLCKFAAEKLTGSEDREQKRLNLQFLRMMTEMSDLESEVKVAKSYQLYILLQ